MTDPLSDALPRLPPAEAIDYLRGKGYKIGFAWQDVWQEEHAKAFTVAKAMSVDLLETIRAAVDKALAKGETLEQFRAELTPILQAKGWWGRKPMRDPATGQVREVQLGSPRRLRIIYETNLRMAQAAGRWAAIQRTKRALPYLRYTAVMDERTRPEHREWHGTILPVDDPWWDTHYPPCGWNCRCTTIQLDAASIAERGWRVDATPPPADPPRAWTNPRTGAVIDVPAGIDPGFAYNPGKAWLQGVEPGPFPEPPLPAPPADSTRLPEGLLPADVSEQGAVDAFVAEASEPGASPPAQRQSSEPNPAETAKPVIALRGDELAPFDAHHARLRASAKAWLRDRRSTSISNPAIGRVRISGAGIKKLLSTTPAQGDAAEKLRTVPAVPTVIRNGTVTTQPNSKLDRPSVEEVALAKAPVRIAGEDRTMVVLLRKQEGEWGYYGHWLEKAPSDRPLQSGRVSVDAGHDTGGLSHPKTGDRSASHIVGAEGLDKIITDVTGFELAVGPGRFLDAGGFARVPQGLRRRVLGLVGRAIRQPREIRLRTVRGANGAPMIMRRYVARFDGIDVVAEFGAAGWRFASSLDPGFDLAALSTGEVVWSAK